MDNEKSQERGWHFPTSRAIEREFCIFRVIRTLLTLQWNLVPLISPSSCRSSEHYGRRLRDMNGRHFADARASGRRRFLSREKNLERYLQRKNSRDAHYQTYRKKPRGTRDISPRQCRCAQIGINWISLADMTRELRRPSWLTEVSRKSRNYVVARTAGASTRRSFITIYPTRTILSRHADTATWKNTPRSFVFISTPGASFAAHNTFRNSTKALWAIRGTLDNGDEGSP